MTKRATYLDWNATAPVRPEVVQAVTRALGMLGNPSSIHGAGRAARRLLNEARDAVAALVHAAGADVIFTSGGTEANALALAGFPERRIVVCAIEHASVLENADAAAVVPVDNEGRADLAALARILTADTRPALVSLMLANNETGVIEDVTAAARIAHEHGALLHTDAIQAPGRIQVDFDALGADLMTLSAHKMGGPMGVGALVVRAGLDPRPMIRGGGQEKRRRSGTENLPGIAGFGVAARLAADALDEAPRLTHLRDRAQGALLEIAPGARVFGANTPRLPNTISISMPGVAASTQVMSLDLAGVMVSAGAACSSGKVQRSHVLAAMGAPSAEADCAIRISLGGRTTEADIAHLIEAWGTLYARTRASAA